MPVSLRRGAVTGILERHEGLVRLEVDGTPCVAYPRLTGPVEIGDEVLVNVQARELRLGSGGFDILYANLTRGLDLPAEPGAHLVKLPYTPLQHAVRHLEEEPPDVAPRLDGLPVVCCSLHSQVPPVLAGVGEAARVAYLQLPGGALPVDLSDAIRGARVTAVGVGPCFGGDHDAVSLPSALAWASAGHDVAVCSVGPGIVGTGTLLGHGGVAAAEAANAAAALGGLPILAARVSDADERERHRGVSHHTRAALELSLGDVTVAWAAGREAPAWLEPREEVDASGWREACRGLPLSHMGRGPDEDPAFFEAAYAAGLLARRLVPGR